MERRVSVAWVVVLAAVPALCGVAVGDVSVTGGGGKWRRVTITYDGPECGEDGEVNPFLDYRLMVTFRNGGREFLVPGFFAADGNACQTGATEGNKWRVYFRPDRTGVWECEASFRKGKDIAISLEPNAGEPCDFDGAKVQFSVPEGEKEGRDFRARGALQYEGERYLRFADTGGVFLKAGAGSPENFLAYYEFDGTYDAGALTREGEAKGDEFLHRYGPHVRDWKEGDPVWQGGKGKGIIGAINYLASQGMNSIYFISYNVDGGDGKDVWPWVAPNRKKRFDVSKLDQWEVVFNHMERKGVMMHWITQEQENDQGLDGGELGIERKLYYRELIARFGHHLALVWNLGEENTNTDAQRRAFCEYIKAVDPYDHPIVCHTHPGKYDEVYKPLLGFDKFDGVSLQIDKRGTHAETVKWVRESGKAGRQWFICHDETTPAQEGVRPDANAPRHDEVRRYALWGNLMAGGAGCEWYFGYKYANNDLNCEDWRSREQMWKQTRVAVEFFQKLPLLQMEPADELVRRGWCLAKAPEVYAVYLPEGGEAELGLGEGTYGLSWYDPRKGGELIDGGKVIAEQTGKVKVGPCPTKDDWAAIVTMAGD